MRFLTWAGGDEERREREEGARLTDKVDDTVGDAQRAGRLHAPAELDDLRSQLPPLPLGRVRDALLLHLEASKVLAREVDEAGTDVLADQVLALGVLSLGGHLDLQAASTKTELHDGLAALGLGIAGLVGIPLVAHAPDARERPDTGIVLLYLIMAGDAQVDAALADKSGYVGRGEEDEGDGQVLHQGDVEAVLALELDVGAFEEVQRRLEKTALLNGGYAGSVIARSHG